MVRVWCDYTSIPQACAKTQMLAINSISSYAGCAHAFIMVAPTCTHTGSQQTLNRQTYQDRMWCRAEQLCHSLRNGARSQMWLATESGCAHVSAEDKDTLANMQVFHGEATKESDKLCLVLPILGLYMELYAARDLPHVKNLLDCIVVEKMFPDTVTIDGHVRSLFEGLATRARKIVDTNPLVRAKARQTHVKRDEVNAAWSAEEHHGHLAQKMFAKAAQEDRMVATLRSQATGLFRRTATGSWNTSTKDASPTVPVGKKTRGWGSSEKKGSGRRFSLGSRPGKAKATPKVAPVGPDSEPQGEATADATTAEDEAPGVRWEPGAGVVLEPAELERVSARELVSARGQ
jgi:hypothetical protein